MNITFVLGNGFDIGLGLKTGYESFYKEYCKTTGKENANIADFKYMLSKRQDDEVKRVIDWADFEKAFGQHSEDFRTEDKDAYIERFEDFVATFNAYLEDEEKWADFNQKDTIGRTMKNAVTIYFQIRTEDKDVVQRVYNSITGNRVYNFISFNYTQSVDRCAQILKDHIKGESQRSVGKVLHIHGFIEENMIMGVNDPTQITNSDFANDPDIVREIVKPNQNSDVRANYERQVLDCINSSDIICVYGMSIGETDKKWWKAIAEWLAKSNRHALVILKYDRAYNKRFPFKQVKFINAVVDNFLALSEQSDDVKELIRTRVFVGMNHNVFEMNLRKKPSDRYDTIIEIVEHADKAVEYAQRNKAALAELLEV